MNKQTKSIRTKIADFFTTKLGRILLIVSALVLAYIFASWAVDSGSILDYAIMFILLFIAARELSSLVRQQLHKK